MFESAKLKIERANHHIADLEGQFHAWLDSDPCSLMSEPQPHGGLKLTIKFIKQMPDELFALIIGDAIHNARTALDHLTWELIDRAGGKQDRWLKFPAGPDRTSFEAGCGGMKDTPKAVKDMLKATEAFPGGKGELLYILHHLDNADKRCVMTPIAEAPTVSKLVIRDPVGKLALTMENCKFAGNTKGGGGALILAKFGAGYAVDDTDGTKITTEILFGQIEFVQHQPVIPTLTRLRDAASNTIDTIERATI